LPESPLDEDVGISSLGYEAIGEMMASAAGKEGDFRTVSGGLPMQAIAISTTPAVWTVRTGKQGLPDPVRRPPGNPPHEPIIIKIPPRLPEVPEVDRSDDQEEEEAEIRRPPEIVPELPPPPRPEERAVRPTQRIRSTAITR
jgi:hypothetical protein